MLAIIPYVLYMLLKEQSTNYYRCQVYCIEAENKLPILRTMFHLAINQWSQVKLRVFVFDINKLQYESLNMFLCWQA